jgi:putative oxidoreductase
MNIFTKYRDGLQLVGRILISILFLVAGFGKISNYAGTGAYMAASGLPLVGLLEPLTILTEFGGAILVILGLYTRWVGLLWFLFLIPVTLVFHTSPNAMHTAQDQMINLMKNMSIMGAALYLMANGAGRFSIDQRRGAA